jgi:hypothetical protein
MPTRLRRCCRRLLGTPLCGVFTIVSGVFAIVASSV